MAEIIRWNMYTGTPGIEKFTAIGQVILIQISLEISIVRKN